MVLISEISTQESWIWVNSSVRILWDIYPIVSYWVPLLTFPPASPGRIPLKLDCIIILHSLPLSEPVGRGKDRPMEIDNCLECSGYSEVSPIVECQLFRYLEVLTMVAWWRAAMVGLTWLTGVTWLFSGSDESPGYQHISVVITPSLLSQWRNIYECRGGIIHWLGCGWLALCDR